MLTQTEREWLERREEMPGYYCLWCPLWDDEADCDGRSPHPFCPIFQRRERLWDAAEFSERVAAKLAIIGDIWDFEDMPCRGDERQYIRINCKLRKNHWDCADCFLKAARLKVEEEMDGTY